MERRGGGGATCVSQLHQTRSQRRRELRVHPAAGTTPFWFGSFFIPLNISAFLLLVLCFNGVPARAKLEQKKRVS